MLSQEVKALGDFCNHTGFFHVGNYGEYDDSNEFLSHLCESSDTSLLCSDASFAKFNQKLLSWKK